jgi:hypothetical protein
MSTNVGFQKRRELRTLRIMRIQYFLPLAVVSLAAVLNAQDVDERLKWARETIDANAVTRHFEPPARSSGTKWRVMRIDGCTVELKETNHREVPESVFTSDGVFGLSQDKVVTWTFNLASLKPDFIMADTSVGVPHVKIFAEGDAFHLQTEGVSRTVRKDGSVVSTTNWDTPGNTRNLWMYFDSPTADNKLVVRRLETDLRDAVNQCAAQAGLIHARAAADHHR